MRQILLERIDVHAFYRRRHLPIAVALVQNVLRPRTRFCADRHVFDLVVRNQLELLGPHTRVKCFTANVCVLGEFEVLVYFMLPHTNLGPVACFIFITCCLKNNLGENETVMSNINKNKYE